MSAKFFACMLLACTLCFAEQVDWGSNIHYEKPELYLVNGKQTLMNNKEWKNEMLSMFPKEERSLNQLVAVSSWIDDSFVFDKGHGVTIGVITSDEIYNSKQIRGSHDKALVFSSIVRFLGYPCIFVDTTSITWSKNYNEGLPVADYALGHVFVEVYFEGKWVLFDVVKGVFLDSYDVKNPYILIDWHEFEPIGFYVIDKGRDNWDFGIYSLEDLTTRQKSIAPSVAANYELISSNLQK
ncbi:MAG: transglutaminase domain-containing protein [Chlamydiales bacterium]|nr:transglutaminase domain-containing protein [Chlamydiales bacterium]